jgi:ABC-type dipeptide/oligopeptide/nickel transport system permease component
MGIWSTCNGDYLEQNSFHSYIGTNLVNCCLDYSHSNGNLCGQTSVSFRSQSFSFLSFLGMSLRGVFSCICMVLYDFFDSLVTGHRDKITNLYIHEFPEKVLDRALHLVPPMIILVIPRIDLIMRIMRGQFRRN